MRQPQVRDRILIKHTKEIVTITYIGINGQAFITNREAVEDVFYVNEYGTLWTYAEVIYCGGE